MTPGLPRRAAAEVLGTGVLVAAVVGSGIMATDLTDDLALALLVNALSTVAALGVLIWALGPISGAHFNPAVTAVAWVRKEIRPSEGATYMVAQVAGALLGVALANVMFDLPAWQASTNDRVALGTLVGEVVATAGLLAVIGALTRTGRGHLGPILVPAWIGAAYFFTASTSFANPAVTIGRAFTDTFTGIAPASVAPFIAAQLVGAAVGALLTEFFYPRRGVVPEPLDLPEPVHNPEGSS
ncbi:MAG: aquaporin family protein [Actinobacteria bacterium]|nr:aquaporin family protein [Actinomycetota bacterium]HRY08993.1 MIP/aquaporin family protein [Candidatus Nanopelagicales bacterium]